MKTLLCLLALSTICISSNLYVLGQTLKSQSSTQLVYVRFWNQSNRRCSLIWIDYNGNPTVYKALEPNEIFDFNTYVSHPWIFQGPCNGEGLLGNRQAVFMPAVRAKSDAGAQVVLTERNETRTLVSITEMQSCCPTCAMFG